MIKKLLLTGITRLVVSVLLFNMANVLAIAQPVINSFNPTSGTVGTTVTIKGTNLTGATAVSFGDSAALSFIVISDTGITATVASGASGSVSVTTPGGTESLAGFIYLKAPKISSFNPTSGTVGTTVTISGTNFNNTPTNNIVFFGATRATVQGATSNSLVLTIPTGATYQPISVTDTTTGLTAYSVNPFITTFPGGVAFDTSYFAVKVDFVTGTFPWNVAIGDIDGDGKPDLVVTNYTSNTISVFRNTSTSTNGIINSSSFAAKVDFATGPMPIGISICDLDGDGKSDLAVTNYGSNKVSIFRNTSSSGIINSSSFAAKVDFSTSTSPNSISITDLDGDGKPDIVVSNYNSNKISVLRNKCNKGVINANSFAIKIDYTTGTAPIMVSIGDLNCDGKPDLAVVNSLSNTVSVFRNNCKNGIIDANSFDAKVDYTTGSIPRSISIGDLNGDDKSELVVGNVNANTVSVFKNTSKNDSISFAGKIDYPTRQSPIFISIGDLDGDGKLDLAVANINSNRISIHKNTTNSGILSFANMVVHLANSGPNCVTIGDLDGDGKPDLVIANQVSNTISILKNLNAPPVISSFSPNSGGTDTMITIKGTNFTGSTAVNFGGTAAGSFTVVSDTIITAIVTTGSSGSIGVTTPYGTTSLAGFTYKINQVIIFDALSSTTYGDSVFALSATGGASGNPVVFTSSNPSVATCTGTNGDTITIVNAGSCIINANQAGDGTYYMATQVSQSLIINPKALIITDVSASNKVYDGTDTATLTGGSLNGIIGSDTVTLIAGTGVFGDKNTGNGKTVTASGFTLGGINAENYLLNAQPSGLTADITPASLTATANDASKTYGDNNPVFTITYTGFVTGEDTDEISVPTVACTATETSNTGGYTITLSGGSAINYSLTPVNGLLTINKAMLTATADDKTRKEGENNPVFSIAYNGFKNSEMDAVLDTKPVVICTADASSMAGDYDITVAGGVDNNYDFTYVSGKLTITPSTGISDATKAGYIVYPNPAKDYLVIKSPNASAIKVKVFDISGRLVLESKLVNEQLNLQSLAPGLYNLKIDNYNYKVNKK